MTEIADDGAISMPYLLFSVGKNIYAINSEYVRGIETLTEYTTIVDSDPTVRGGVFYQDSFIPLIDMRKLFRLSSQLEEFEKTVNPEQRIKDHENWVSALEKSVFEQTEFTLTDDPHKCALGKWYYAYKTDNNVLKMQLSALEAPHEAVHNTAKDVKRLMREGRQEQAADLIREMRATHYAATLQVLATLRDTMAASIKELYVVVDGGAGRKGLIVDSIVGVEDFEHMLELPDALSSSRFICGLGRRAKDDAVTLILNDSLLD